MKVNYISTLLLTLQISTASGSATDDSCEDFEIVTEQDCNDMCRSLSGGSWSGSVRGPASAIIECSCSFSDGDFSCRKAPDTPDDPVIVTEDCEERGIETWDDCKAECNTLADGTGYSAHIKSGMGNISACLCEYGRSMENSYTCTRATPPIPYPRSTRCLDDGITDQQTCFDFCLEYQTSPQYISSAGALLKCRCRDGQGGSIKFECSAGSSSYLRAD